MLELLVLSFLSAYGMAVVFVEKGNEWPIIRFKEPLRGLLMRISPNLAKVIECSICLSFWTTLLTDLMLCIVTKGRYFAWPLSGFITVGLTWTIYSILNAIDPTDEEKGI